MAVSTATWTDAELDESILKLCEEFPDVRMSACSRALEHCRKHTPHGSPGSLLNAMRHVLQHETATGVSDHRMSPSGPERIPV